LEESGLLREDGGKVLGNSASGAPAAARARAAKARKIASGGGAMPSPPRRRGRPKGNQFDQLKRDFLKHALDYFLDQGFDATRISDLTRSFGMSKQTVYTHFGDKLGLFKAALRSATDDWLVPLEDLGRLESDDLQETLVAVSRVIVETLMSEAGVRLIRITNSESYRLPEIGELTYHRGHRQIARYLCDLFARRIYPDAQAAPDLEDLATAFLNLMSGPARRSAWGLGAEESGVDGFIRRRVSLFLHGVLPKGGHAAR
jgi:AcrR family transcriptional regulator